MNAIVQVRICVYPLYCIFLLFFFLEIRTYDKFKNEEKYHSLAPKLSHIRQRTRENESPPPLWEDNHTIFLRVAVGMILPLTKVNFWGQREYSLPINEETLEKYKVGLSKTSREFYPL